MSSPTPEKQPPESDAGTPVGLLKAGERGSKKVSPMQRKSGLPPPPNKELPEVQARPLRLSEIQDLLERWDLEGDQLLTASYETLLLLLNLGDGLSEEQNGVLFNTVRIGLQIGSKRHHSLIAQLKPEGVKEVSRERMNQVMYRLDLISALETSLFDSEDQFKACVKRHIAVVVLGVISAVSATTMAHWSVEGKECGRFEAIHLIEQKFKDFSDSIANAKGVFNAVFAGLPAVQEMTDDILRQCDSHVKTTVEKLKAAADPNTSVEQLDVSVMSDDDNNMILKYEYPMTLVIYELLLMACFMDGGDDDFALDDSDEVTLVPNFEDVVDLYKPVRDVFKIDERLHEICFVGVLFQKWEMCKSDEIRGQLLKQIRGLPPLDAASRTNKPGKHDVFSEYVEAVMVPLSRFLEQKFADVRENYVLNPDDIDGDIELFEAISHYLKPDQSLATALEELLSASMKSHYNRVKEQYDPPMSMETLKEVTQILLEEITVEADIFAPKFERHSPHALSSSLGMLVELFKKDVQDAFQGSEHIDQEIVSILPLLEQWQRAIMKLVGDETKVDIIQVCMPIVFEWMAEQTTNFDSVLQRSVAAEKWESVIESEDELQYSTSAIDLFGLFEGTVNVFVERFPTTRQMILFLATAIDKTVQAYGEEVADSCGDEAKEPQFMPKNNRKAEKRRKNSFKQNLLGRIKKNTEVEDVVLYDIPFEDDYVLKRISIKSLCIRCNCLTFARRKLKELGNKLEDAWKERAVLVSDHSGPLNLDELFQPALDRLDAAVTLIIRSIAKKIVYYHLREPLYKNMYHPSVQTSRVDELFPLLDTHMEEVMTTVDDEYSDRVVPLIARVFFAAWGVVLIHEDSQRFFFPKETDMLTDDLNAIKDFFMAKDEDGEPQGMSQAEADSMTGQLLVTVANLFEASSEFLIYQYKTTDQFPFTKNNVRRVLWHRSDHLAKEFRRAVKRGHPIP
eukprot:GFYU01026164.1.p1 GENE.GFYU01026164.1~~GFYU01026164.1.p1  ORF type:complete len:1005 (+),score=235.60 GFYU01026164.1:129-3017(+)